MAWDVADDFAFDLAYGDSDAANTIEADSSILGHFAVQTSLRKITCAELAQHNSPDDCWVAFHGHVYDMTQFAKQHVGGADSITRLAGQDGTLSFARHHSQNVLNSISKDYCKGELLLDGVAPSIIVAKEPSMDHEDDKCSQKRSVLESGTEASSTPAVASTLVTSKRQRGCTEKSVCFAIVVGGGLAGFTASATVIEHGGSVMLLEKAAFCGGNSTKASSGINGACTAAQHALGIVDSPDTFTADTLVGGAKKPELAGLLCRNSGEAVEWLATTFGLDLSLVNRLGGHSQARTHRGKERFPGMTITYAMMQMIESIAERSDVAQILTKAQVVRLLVNDTGVCEGCVYERLSTEYRAEGPVILCTGGFGADFRDGSLLAQYRPDLLHLPTTNSEHSTGDGIKMARAVGAKTVDLEWVQVHPTGLVNPVDPQAKIKFLAAEALRGVGGIIIDAHGRRFVNELGRRDHITKEMWHNQAPFRLLVNSAAAQEVIWHCKHYVSRGVMKLYSSGRQLAEEICLPLCVLEEVHEAHYRASTLTHENPNGGPWAAYPDGKSWDEASGRTGAGKRFYKNVISGAQVQFEAFYVAEITPVIHYCMGGVEITTDATVLNADDLPVKGLWAAGEVAGGVHGNNRLGGNALLECVVFGRVAGKACSQYMCASGAHLERRSLADSACISTHKKQEALSTEQETYTKSFTLDEVSSHRTREDCWIVVSGQVLDVTKFLRDHPGGALPLLAVAGKDATAEYNLVHPPGLIAKYAHETVLGQLTLAKPKVQDDVLPNPLVIVSCPCCQGHVKNHREQDGLNLAECISCNIEVRLRRL